MIRYLYGPDTYTAYHDIRTFAEQAKSSIRWVDQEDVSAQPLSSYLFRGMATLFGSELLVVRDASRMAKGAQEELVSFVKEGDGSCIVWDRFSPDKRSALFRALKSKGKEYVIPDHVDAHIRWVQEYAVSCGGGIDMPAARALIERSGSDRWMLSSEIDKMLLVDSNITEEMVRTHACTHNESEVIFRLLDAVISGNTASAVALTERHIEAGDSELYILSMLAYQFRTLFHIRLAIDKGVSMRDIASEAGLHPYVVEKNMRFARALSAHQLLDILARIMATDVAVKGKADPRTGLMMLTLSLSSHMQKTR